jgi:hypothetical protein
MSTKRLEQSIAGSLSKKLDINPSGTLTVQLLQERVVASLEALEAQVGPQVVPHQTGRKMSPSFK